MWQAFTTIMKLWLLSIPVEIYRILSSKEGLLLSAVSKQASSQQDLRWPWGHVFPSNWFEIILALFQREIIHHCPKAPHISFIMRIHYVCGMSSILYMCAQVCSCSHSSNAILGKQAFDLPPHSSFTYLNCEAHRSKSKDILTWVWS